MKDVVKAKLEAFRRAGDYTSITLREMVERHKKQGYQLMPVA